MAEGKQNLLSIPWWLQVATSHSYTKGKTVALQCGTFRHHHNQIIKRRLIKTESLFLWYFVKNTKSQPNCEMISDKPKLRIQQVWSVFTEMWRPWKQGRVRRLEGTDWGHTATREADSEIENVRACVHVCGVSWAPYCFSLFGTYMWGNSTLWLTAEALEAFLGPAYNLTTGTVVPKSSSDWLLNVTLLQIDDQRQAFSSQSWRWYLLLFFFFLFCFIVLEGIGFFSNIVSI